jgi:phosphatidylglycerophosphate synthase
MYPIKAAAVFLAVLAVAIAVPGGATARVFAPADWITALRAFIVALVAGLVGEAGAAQFAAAAAAGGAAALALDGVDGWIARRTQASPFGARFDMEVDALLILVLAVLCWQIGKAGVWVLASGLLRYAFLAAAAVWPWMGRPLPPSRRRQTVCVVQVMALLVALAPLVEPPLSALVAAAALTALSWSFVVDTLWLYHHAR